MARRASHRVGAGCDCVGRTGTARRANKLIDQYDLGQATLAMTIAATDLGIGTRSLLGGRPGKARAILGVPDDHIVSYLLGVGYPADRPFKPILKPNRRPFTEVVHRGRW